MTESSSLHDALYERLSAPLMPHFSREIGGGEEAEYVTGEQVTSRLNAVLGPTGWTFEVREHGMDVEADEFWVLGALTITVGPTTVRREQFGSQKIKRARQTGTPLDIGFDLKGAATDALKKCATLIGVGLDLTAKSEPGASTPAAAGTRRPVGGAVDWTVAWQVLKARGIDAAEVQRRLGQPLGDYARAVAATTESLLADDRLQAAPPA